MELFALNMVVRNNVAVVNRGIIFRLLSFMPVPYFISLMHKSILIIRCILPHLFKLLVLLDQRLYELILLVAELIEHLHAVVLQIGHLLIYLEFDEYVDQL